MAKFLAFKDNSLKTIVLDGNQIEIDTQYLDVVKLKINKRISSLIFDPLLAVLFLHIFLNLLSYHLTQSQINPIFGLSQHQWQFLNTLKVQPNLVLYLSLAFVGQLHRHYDFIINIIHSFSKDVKRINSIDCTFS